VIVRIVVIHDGETYGGLDGCVILEVGPIGLAALENGQKADRLVRTGQARLVAEFVNGQFRLLNEVPSAATDEERT
jgi:hypothetical protein